MNAKPSSGRAWTTTLREYPTPCLSTLYPGDERSFAEMRCAKITLCSLRPASAVDRFVSTAGSAIAAATALMASQSSATIHILSASNVLVGCACRRACRAIATDSLVRHLGSRERALKVRRASESREGWVEAMAPIAQAPQKGRNSLGSFVGASDAGILARLLQSVQTGQEPLRWWAAAALAKSCASSKFPLGPGRLLLAARYSAISPPFLECARRSKSRDSATA